MIRVVLDTNIVVSALLKPDGNERRLLRMGLAGQFAMLVSPAILAEYQGTLARPKFRLQPDEVAATIEGIRNAVELVDPDVTVTIAPDDADNRFLECAQAGKADYLVTGNKRHFPERFGRTRILNARHLLELLTPEP